jgi:hypothetical protein
MCLGVCTQVMLAEPQVPCVSGHIHVVVHARTHAHAHTHMHTHMRTYAHAHSHALEYALLHVHTHTHTDTQIFLCTWQKEQEGVTDSAHAHRAMSVDIHVFRPECQTLANGKSELRAPGLCLPPANWGWIREEHGGPLLAGPLSRVRAAPR